MPNLLTTRPLRTCYPSIEKTPLAPSQVLKLGLITYKILHHDQLIHIYRNKRCSSPKLHIPTFHAQSTNQTLFKTMPQFFRTLSLSKQETVPLSHPSRNASKRACLTPISPPSLLPFGTAGLRTLIAP